MTTLLSSSAVQKVRPTSPVFFSQGESSYTEVFRTEVAYVVDGLNDDLRTVVLINVRAAVFHRGDCPSNITFSGCCTSFRGSGRRGFALKINKTDACILALVYVILMSKHT